MTEAFSGGGVGAVSFDFFTLSARFEDLVVPQQGPYAGSGDVFRIPECRAELNWRAFFSRDLLHLRRVVLSEPEVRILRSREGLSSGRLVLASLERLAERIGRRRFRIDRLEVQDGQVEFCDLAPDQTVRHVVPLRRLTAQFESLNNHPEGAVPPGRWSGSGFLGQSGAPLHWEGKVGPLAAPLSFELERLECDRLALVEISSQIEETAGCRPITGTLAFRVRASCEQGRIRAAKLDLNLSGAAVEPLTMAGRELAAYVRARDGRIDETFSLSGTWDAPQVEADGLVSRIVWQKISNGVVGFLAFPFRLVGSIFGGGGE